MAESMFSNVYDARQKDLEGAVDYGASLAALPRGRVSVAVAGQSGGMLGQGLSSLAGALPPEQAQQAKMDELMSRFPNPTTYEDYMAIAGEFMTSGMQDMGEYFLKLANDIKDGEKSYSDSSNLGKYYQDALTIEGCEAGDVECEKRARKLMFRFKKPEDAVSKEMGGWAGKKLGESKDTAEKSIASIRTISRANRLIDKGITTGSFSGSRNSIARFFNTIGWTEDETVGATDEYLATLGYLVKDILGSGDFGAGTGLSDKDVEFVMRMVGSDTDIDEASLRRILNISERAHRETIKRHNDFSGQFDSETLDRAGLKGFKFSLKMPDWSAGGPTGAGTSQVEYSEEDEAMFAQDGI